MTCYTSQGGIELILLVLKNVIFYGVTDFIHAFGGFDCEYREER